MENRNYFQLGEGIPILVDVRIFESRNYVYDTRYPPYRQCFGLVAISFGFGSAILNYRQTQVSSTPLFWAKGVFL